MLHILNHSPWRGDIDGFIRMLRPDDDLLLIQDGVLAAINDNRFIKIFTEKSVSISALKEDIEARGLHGLISTKINIVNYIDFVNLTVKHSNQMNW